MSLRDTLECVDPQDLSARLAETPLLASEEVLREVEREEERQKAEEAPRVTLVQEVEAAARDMVSFSEATYVPRVHFFVPFRVDAYVPRKAYRRSKCCTIRGVAWDCPAHW